MLDGVEALAALQIYDRVVLVNPLLGAGTVAVEHLDARSIRRSASYNVETLVSEALYKNWPLAS